MKNKRDILVTSALPYANGPIHIGHLVEYIQTDIWVRFQKMRGHRCYLRVRRRRPRHPHHAAGAPGGHRAGGADRPGGRGAPGGLRRLRASASTTTTPPTPTENRHYANLIYERNRDKGHIASRTITQAYDPVEQMFLPDRFIKGECPKCGAPDQYGDNCEVCGASYSPARAEEPRLGRLRRQAGGAGVGALFLQAGRLRGHAQGVDPRRPPAAGGRQQARRVVRGRPAGVGHLPRRPLLRLRDPGPPGQVLLRLAGRPHRLHGQLPEPVRPHRGAGVRRLLGAGFGRRALPLHRQGHHLLPRPVLAGHAARRGLPHAERRLRPRLPHRGRAEDVQVPRHLHQGAHLPGSSQSGVPALLLRRQAGLRAWRTSTSTWKTSARG